MTVNGWNPNDRRIKDPWFVNHVYPLVKYQRVEPPSDPPPGAGVILAGIAGILVLIAPLFLAGNALAGSEDCRQLLQSDSPGDGAENSRPGPQRDLIKGANPPRIVPCPTAESVQPCDDEREGTPSREPAPYIEADLSARGGMPLERDIMAENDRAQKTPSH